MMSKDELQNLLNSLTLQEKAAQLLQLTGDFFEGSGQEIQTGPESHLGLSQQMVEHAGSILNVIGADTLHQVQEKYLEKSSNKIPLLFMADVINGLKTVFPIPLAQAGSFNPELVHAGAAVSARESAAAGLHVTFSPMADLSRDARWGRVMESSGEDVFLNRRMTRAVVEGYQGERLDKVGTIAACVKHFAAYGAPEAGRDYNSVDLSDKKLMEEYLPGYEEAVKAGCSLVMTSFNTLNGIPVTANCRMTQDVLRKQWGFDGVLISDYAAINELIAHGVAENEEQAAKLAIRAGVDMDMVSPVYGGQLAALAESGKIPVSMVDSSVLRLLELKNKLGLFDNPYRFEQETMNYEQACIGCKEHRALARMTAAETMVLLKNEGVLPIAKGKRVGVIGPFADSKMLCGSWSLFYDEKDVVTVREGMEQAFGADHIFTAKGAYLLDEEQSFISFKGRLIEGRAERESERKTDEELLTQARDLAAQVDVVILALGEHFHQSGEGASKTDLNLPACQLKLLDEVRQINPAVAAVVFSGRPLVLGTVAKQAAAVVQAWFPGTQGGSALADVLFGAVSPSARLPMSFPRASGQEPLSYSHLHTGRAAKPGKKERFVSTYLDCEPEPLFPFGFGLSYTTFAYTDISIDKQEFGVGDSFFISGTIKNTGNRAGAEVVLLFVQDVCGSTARPVKELKGFEKLFLNPGEEKVFTIEIKEQELRFVTSDGVLATEPGLYRVYVADAMLEITRKN